MPFAVVLILLVVGSILFHLLSPWTFTPLASNWGMVDFTVDITLWVTGVIFIAVNLFMAYCVIRFRHRKGVASKAKYEPENKSLELWLTVLTAIGVAAMLTPGLLVWAEFVEVPDEAHEVEAVGQQWHWTFRYPGEDGRFGEVDAERISMDNPFGIDPADPSGQDDVVVMHAEAHLPVNEPVKFLLRSKDVLHDFAVAQFRVKMDLVPGMSTYLWLTPTEIGRFEILCEELCGIAHHTMRGAVVVEDAADFDTWLAQQPTFADTQNRVAGNAAVGQAQYQVCAAC
ncbi:MAG: cytochrome c oxidase subunit II, partial [Woeseiaceae bacterium]|nr:cytochrome c oxidase subunit II [Woeseiaceae bacterium]